MAKSKADKKPKITPAEVVAVNATERLIKQLKSNGTIMSAGKMVDGFHEPLGVPKNMSGYKYRNSNNYIILMMAKMFNPSYGNMWGTSSQIRKKGGMIKPSETKQGLQIEHNFRLYFDKDEKRSKSWPYDRSEQIELEKKGYEPFWCNRYKTVYNIRAQTSGLDAKYYPEPSKVDPTDPKVAEESIKKVQELVDMAGIKLVNMTTTPCYIPKHLEIRMPDKGFFKDGANAWVSTLLHEYSHGLGDPSYLCYNGSGSAPFGSTQYAHEELRAEISAICLSAQLELPYTPSAEGHATSYVKSWIKSLSDDPMYLMRTVKDVVRTLNFSNNLNQDAKPFYDAVDSPMQSHLVSMAVAAGADIESSLENVANGKPPSFMHGTEFHISTIASVYAREMGLATGFAYEPNRNKETLDDVESLYHDYAQKEAGPAIEKIEAAFDADFDDDLDNEANVPKMA